MWLYYTSFSCVFLTLLFFANDLLLVIYFIFILDYGNDVRQRVNCSNFLEFKMGHKAADSTGNINNAFGPRTANECIVRVVVVQEVLQRR